MSMSTTQRIAAWSTFWSAVGTGVLIFATRKLDIAWWVYFLFFVLFDSYLTNSGIKKAARENLANINDWRRN